MTAEPVPEDPDFPAAASVNPPEGIFYSFTVDLWPDFRHCTAIAYGSREQHQAEILPVFAHRAWMGDHGLESYMAGLSLRFPECLLAHRVITDINGPHERTLEQVEREYGALPPARKDPRY